IQNDKYSQILFSFLCKKIGLMLAFSGNFSKIGRSVAINCKSAYSRIAHRQGVCGILNLREAFKYDQCEQCNLPCGQESPV
ncbi:MAG: hypothetical protein K2I21_14330, partial [Acetatifactor sp.]|nr:hypothetical protein [Acetatifactor sp.]